MTIFFSFSILKTLFHSLLACIVSWEKQFVILIFVSLYVQFLFLKLSLRFFSLSLVLLINVINAVSYYSCLNFPVLCSLSFVFHFWKIFLLFIWIFLYFLKYSWTFISGTLKSCGNSLIFYETCFWTLLGGNKKPLVQG